MYYFLRQNLFEAGPFVEIVGHTAETQDLPWIRGVRFDRQLPEITLELDTAYGTELPDFFDTTIPVMSERLLQALAACGISNLDTYPVHLRDPIGGTQTEGYRAVNVIGAVDAADLVQSQYSIELGDPYFTGRIVLDPARTGGLSMFRLVDGPGFIVIDDRVANSVQAGNFRAVLLQPTESYEGA